MSSYRDKKTKPKFNYTRSAYSSIDFSQLENQPIDVTASGARSTIKKNDPSGSNTTNQPADNVSGNKFLSMGGKEKDFVKAFGDDPMTQRRNAKAGRDIKRDKFQQAFKDEKQKIKNIPNKGPLGITGMDNKEKNTRIQKARLEKNKLRKSMNTPLNYLNPNTMEVQGDAGQPEEPSRAGRPVNSNVLMNDPMNYQDPSKVSAQQTNQEQLFSGLASSMGENPEPMIPGMTDQSITPGQQAPFQKKSWISKAIKKPGQLHRDLGVPEGEKIPSSKLDAALAGNYGKKTKQRAELAKTLKSFKK
tara:strand:- start:9851 stop:10759 length:909 start_codon:yes stop_codon:yes gene_type:complete